MKQRCFNFKAFISAIMIILMTITTVSNGYLSNAVVFAREFSDGILTEEIPEISEGDIAEQGFIPSAVDGMAEATSYSYYGNGYQVTFTLDSRWDTAFNARIEIQNTGHTAIENWLLEFQLNNQITNIWNASVAGNENGKYRIKNASWNQDILPGNTVSFGFTAEGSFEGFPGEYIIPIIDKNPSHGNYEIIFNVVSDWGAGFSATMEIKNLSDRVIEDWTLEFDFEKNITDIWNGTIKEHNENHYIIGNAGYNQNIGPWGSVSFGFNGVDGNVSNHPQNYSLYEIGLKPEEPEEPEEYVELADGRIRADYLNNVILPKLRELGLPTDKILLADDYDSDGLTLGVEIEYGTNPFSKDTDEDGLNDYDEVMIYGTNPVDWDTDKDGMGDGTEVLCGLNPLLADSDGNGISDGEEIVEQPIRNQSFDIIDLTVTGVKPEVWITGQGDYSRFFTVETYPGALKAARGMGFRFYYDEGMDFQSSILQFRIRNDILEQNELTDLIIASYEPQSGRVVLLETHYNENENIIYTDIRNYDIADESGEQEADFRSYPILQEREQSIRGFGITSPPVYYVLNYNDYLINYDDERPSAPSRLVVTERTDSVIQINWDASTDNIGIRGYEVFLDDELQGFVSELAYRFEELQPETSYIIGIRAVDLNGNVSEVSNLTVTTQKEEVIIIPAPQNLQAVREGRQGILLTWTILDSEGLVEGYAITCDGILVGNTTDPSFRWEGRIGETYHFTVISLGKNDLSSDPAEIEINLEVIKPSTPMNLTALSVTGEGIELTWEDPERTEDIAGYRIYRNEEEIGVSEEAIYLDETAAFGELYLYQVKSFDVYGESSEYSNSIIVRRIDILPPEAPGKVSAEQTGPHEVELSWEESLDNDMVAVYDIYMDSERIDTILADQTSYSIHGLTIGETYLFSVRAKDREGNVSEESEVIEVTILPEAPVISAVSEERKQIKVIWNEVEDATGYEISINDEVIEVGKVNTYIQTEFLPETLYTYRVRSMVGEHRSPWSDAMDLLTKPHYADLVVEVGTTLVLDRDMEVGNLTVKGELFLNGYELIVHGDVFLDSGWIHFNRGRLLCSGGMSVWGYLDMSYPEDYLLVRGKMTINIAYGTYFYFEGYFWSFNDFGHRDLLATLTDGVMELKGDLQVTNGALFHTAGAHRTIFSGEQVQQIDLESLLCHFTSVEYRNTSPDGIFMNKKPTEDKVWNDGSVITLTEEYKGWVLYEDTVIEGSLFLDGGALDLNGYQLLVNGSFFHTGGTLYMNGGQMQITGNYSMAVYEVMDGKVICKEGSGTLIMTNPQDYLKIGSSFMMDSNQWKKDNLTEGIIEIGNYIGRGSDVVETPFIASKNHLVLSDHIFLDYTTIKNIDKIPCRYIFAKIQVNQAILAHKSFKVTESLSVELILGEVHFEGDIRLLSDTRIINYSDSNNNYGDTVFFDKGTFFLGEHRLSLYCKVAGNGSIDIEDGELLVYWDNDDERIISQDINVNRGLFETYSDIYITSKINICQGIFRVYGSIYLSGKIMPDQGVLYCLRSLIILKNVHMNQVAGAYAPTGNYSYQSMDLAVENSKDEIQFLRNYNSQSSDENSVFGRGWQFNFDSRMEHYSDKNKVVTRPDGTFESFTENYDIKNLFAGTQRSTMYRLADGNYTITTKEKIQYGYDSEGFLQWIKDKDGNQLTITYGSNDKPSTIRDYARRLYTLTYNKDDILTKITDPVGRTVSYIYDSKNQLIQVTDPEGISTYYEYNEDGLLITVRNAEHTLVEEVDYVLDHGLVKVNYTTDRYGNVHAYTYDVEEGKTTITDSNGRHTVQWYDETYYINYSMDTEGKETQVVYFTDYYEKNINGEIKSITDRNGNTTTYERDGQGNITKIIHPDSSIQKYAYDQYDNCISETDAQGNSTYYIYDETGTHLLKVIQPLNGMDSYSESADQERFAITEYTYYPYGANGINLYGLIHTIQDPEHNVTRYTYDSFGNLSSRTNSKNQTTRYVYDDIGQLIQSISPKGEITEYTYNQNGQPLTVKTHGGELTLIRYDALGRKIQEISPNLNARNLTGEIGTRYTHYKNGLLYTVTDAEGYTTTYTYDFYGNIITETRANGSSYHYTYDQMDRVLTVSFRSKQGDELELLRSYSYAILENGTTQKVETVYLNDQEIAVTTERYDYAGRVLEQIHPDGGIISTTYYGNGATASVTDARGRTTYYRYDGMNRLVGVWTPFADGEYSCQRMTYDKNGNMVKQEIGIDAVSLWGVPKSALTTEYQYGADNQLVKTIDPSGGIKCYEYDENGNLSKEIIYLTSLMQKVTEYYYHHLGEVAEVVQYVEAGDVYGFEFSDETEFILRTVYDYDANGNISSVRHPNGTIISFVYDNLDRAISQTVTEYRGTHILSEVTTYTSYDYQGNVLTAMNENGFISKNRYNAKGLLTEAIDPLGGITSYSYDRAGRLITKVLPEQQAEEGDTNFRGRGIYTYDRMGRILLEQDEYYDTQTKTYRTIDSKAYQYDKNGNTIKVLDALGLEAGEGNSLSERISTGYGTLMVYNDANLLTLTQSPVVRDAGYAYDYQYAYDAAGRRIAQINGLNEVIRTDYDGMGRVLRVRMTENGQEKILESYSYDGIGNVLAHTDGNGNTILFTYNRLGLVKSRQMPSDESVEGYLVRYQYDPMGRVAHEIDSLGKERIQSYNFRGQVVRTMQQRADGNESIEWTNRYDAVGNLIESVDANGKKTEYRYDALNRLIATIQSVNGVRREEKKGYDRNGNIISETDWRGNTYHYTYDPLNRLIQKSDPYGITIESYEYNDNHAQIKSYDALGYVTEYRYDRNNRIVSTINGEGNESFQSYDVKGNIASVTDGNSQTTTYTYDILNRLFIVTNAKGETTTYTYDPNGNLLTQTDGMGNRITFAYNARNQLSKKIFPGSAPEEDRTITYTYYGDETVKTMKDRNGTVFTYNYDIHGRLLTKTIGETTETYTYDGVGNLLTMTDATGTTVRTYDELGRVLTKETPHIGIVTFTYDITKDIEEGFTKERTRDSEGNVTERIYDKAGRLWKVISGESTAEYTYYKNGSRESIRYDNGIKEEYTYDANRQIKTLTNTDTTGKELEAYRYTYDGAGNQLSKDEIIHGEDKGITSYAYDELSRLISVYEPNGRQTSYEYDKAGNRIKETIETGNNPVIHTEKTYTYNPQNQLTGLHVEVNNILTEVQIYRNDSNGNRLAIEVREYINGDAQTARMTESNQYDLRNQLIETITENGTIVRNTYNGEGYRVKKEVITNEEGKESSYETTHFLYEGDKVILEVDENGNETAYNVYGTNLLARSVGGETYYYLYNGHADVTALINPNGKVAATYYYDAFGNVLESTGEADNPIRYAGYQYDDETGLYYLNARMYDPKLARFLQEDTYTGDPKDPLSLNLYTYCHNNPIVYHDPTGHKAEKKKENGFIKGLKKAGKSAYRFGKAVVGGAVGIAEGIADGVVGGFDATLLGAEAAYGKMANVFGLMDDETYKYYKEEVDRKFEPYIEYANQPNILRLVTDPIADSITSGLLLFDPKAKKEYNKTKSQKYREDFIPNLASPLQPFKYVLDSDNRHNFFSGSMTDQEMKAYMTNFYSAAMTVFGASKLLKVKPTTIDFNMPSMSVSLGESMAIATSTVSMPTLAWAGVSHGAIAVTATGIMGGRPRYSADNGNEGAGSSKEGSSNTLSKASPYDLTKTHSQTLSNNQLNKLVNDIKINGIQETIKYVEYNGTKYVVNGHHRLLAAKKLGLAEVPIERVELPYSGYATINDLLWRD